MRKLWHHLPGVCLLAILAMPGSIRAQDSITEILKKPALTGIDRGTLEAEVGQRVKKTFGAAGGPVLNDARERLVKPAREKEVSKEGLKVYAELLSGELEQYCAAPEMNTSLAAVLVLEELESPPTVGPLVAALKNKHPSVRYSAARGLFALRAKLKDDDAAARTVITALGEAGAAEKDEHVLRRIYQALNFREVAPDFKGTDRVAASLNQILAARITQLAAGSHDEYRDEEALAVAAGCYPGASARQQAALAANLYSLLADTLEHYTDAGTASEAQPAIARVAQKIEKTLHDCIKASKASPPARMASDTLKGSDRQKIDKDAKAALDELRSVLRGDPWNLS